MRHLFERACVSRVVDHASDDQIDELKRHLTNNARMAVRPWVILNRKFHSTLALISGNRVWLKRQIDLSIVLIALLSSASLGSSCRSIGLNSIRSMLRWSKLCERETSVRRYSSNFTSRNPVAVFA
ncbi:FCD domain-containing protein [Bradyrhizobium frederickii]|uniref:FCD domain-containing protein n=1 Tax=Bradyrhizobium frederickii TaxID=2560054 RepID=A0A4Y9PJ04_9BRAD|nr:FCD domain-containing protein [Bradyrhizobium frederickii]